MGEDVPQRLNFIPKQLIQHQKGVLAIGVEGELQWLDADLNVSSKVSRPFPMPIEFAVISNKHLNAFWLDRELRLAYMASLPLESSQQGITRSELRTSLHTTTVHHPAGSVWSHTLDAEPLALATNGEVLVFVLYKRGLYCIAADAEELWRLPVPQWNYPQNRPRNEDIFAIHIEGDQFLLTSRGGRVQRRSLKTGGILEEFLFEEIEGPLEHHFRHGTNDLLCSASGVLVWLDSLRPVRRVQLRGPIQSAIWDHKLEGWRIAGWREEIILSRPQTETSETSEIPVHIHIQGSRTLILFNDGSWRNSVYSTSKKGQDSLTDSCL